MKRFRLEWSDVGRKQAEKELAESEVAEGEIGWSLVRFPSSLDPLPYLFLFLMTTEPVHRLTAEELSMKHRALEKLVLLYIDIPLAEALHLVGQAWTTICVITSDNTRMLI